MNAPLAHETQAVATARDLPTLDDHWQDFPSDAVIPRGNAGDFYRATTGLRTIVTMLAINHTNDEGARLDPNRGISVLSSMEVEGLLAAAMVLADKLSDEMEDVNSKAWDVARDRERCSGEELA